MKTRLPNDPFGRVAAPGAFGRVERVQLLGAAFEALARGEMPDPRAREFLARNGLRWLRGEGDLLRDLWQVAPPPKSTATPAKLWLRLRADWIPHADEDARNSEL